ACSGLNSLYSLFALGLLYHHVTAGDGAGTEHAPSLLRPLRMAILLACIVPIAIVANVVRVLGLVLVTYHFGAEAAEGWFHTFAGMMVFVIALLMIIGLDRVLFAERHTGGVRDSREGAIPRRIAASAGMARPAGRTLLALVAG